MRISDCSSDVCSSDLGATGVLAVPGLGGAGRRHRDRRCGGAGSRTQLDLGAGLRTALRRARTADRGRGARAHRQSDRRDGARRRAADLGQRRPGDRGHAARGRHRTAGSNGAGRWLVDRHPQRGPFAHHRPGDRPEAPGVLDALERQPVGAPGPGAGQLGRNADRWPREHVLRRAPGDADAQRSQCQRVRRVAPARVAGAAADQSNGGRTQTDSWLYASPREAGRPADLDYLAATWSPPTWQARAEWTPEPLARVTLGASTGGDSRMTGTTTMPGGDRTTARLALPGAPTLSMEVKLRW